VALIHGGLREFDRAFDRLDESIDDRSLRYIIMGRRVRGAAPGSTIRSSAEQARNSKVVMRAVAPDS